MQTEFLTIVYRNVTQEEATVLASDHKAVAISWSHALRDRDVAQDRVADLEAELVEAAQVVRDAFAPVQLDISTNKEKVECQQSLLGF